MALGKPIRGLGQKIMHDVKALKCRPAIKCIGGGSHVKHSSEPPAGNPGICTHLLDISAIPDLVMWLKWSAGQELFVPPK